MNAQKRALDNTLPQAAFAYFKNPKDQLLDPIAQHCFEDFVNAYINTPQIWVPLPRKDRGIGDRFIELWQEDAIPIYNAANIQATTETYKISDEIICEQFSKSVTISPSNWAGFVRFQWSPTIVPQFISRVTNWKEQIRESWAEIAPKISSFSLHPDQRLANFREELRKSIYQLGNIDREYANLIQIDGVRPEDYALAYAYNWFKRGTSYIIRSQGLLFRFHNLRDAAVVIPGNQVGDPEEYSQELHWGKILDGFLAVNELPRDEELMIDLLRGLRETTQKDTRFDYQSRIARLDKMRKLDELTGSNFSNNLIKEIVLDVLLSNNIVPVFRSTAGQADIAKLIRKGVDSIFSNVPKIGSVIGNVLCEVIITSINYRLMRSTAIKVRKKLNRDSIWKVYKIPGLNT